MCWSWEVDRDALVHSVFYRPQHVHIQYMSEWKRPLRTLLYFSMSFHIISFVFVATKAWLTFYHGYVEASQRTWLSLGKVLFLVLVKYLKSHCSRTTWRRSHGSFKAASFFRSLNTCSSGLNLTTHGIQVLLSLVLKSSTFFTHPVHLTFSLRPLFSLRMPHFSQ